MFRLEAFLRKSISSAGNKIIELSLSVMDIFVSSDTKSSCQPKEVIL